MNKRKEQTELNQKILKAAFEENDLKVARIIFAEKAETGMSANDWLIRAASLGQPELVNLCIEFGATDLRSALQTAASNGQISIVKQLVEMGVTVTIHEVKLAKENGHRGTGKYLALVRAKKFAK